MRTTARIRRALVSLAAVIVMLACWRCTLRDRSLSRDVASPAAEHAAVGARAEASAMLPSASVPAGLAGTVRDSRGVAVVGARVCGSCAACTPADAPPAICVLTDHAGVYHLPVRDRTALLISAMAEGFAPGEANGGAPVRAEEAPRADLDVVLRSGGARLTGTVVDALGGPVPHALVHAVRFEAGLRPSIDTQANAEGRFELWSAPGRLLLRAEADGYAPASAYRIAPSGDVELVLMPASELRGRVVIAGTDTPVANVEVRARLPNAALSRLPPAVSDGEGAFVLRGLEPGSYLLQAESDSWRGSTLTQVDIGLADRVDGTVLEVTPAVTVTGRVLLREGGKPCQRGDVLLGPSSVLQAVVAHGGSSAARGDVPALFAHIDADGWVRFKGVPPGSYRATVSCIDHVRVEGPESVEVADAPSAPIWKVAPGLGLLVRVVDALQKPVPRAQLSMIMERPGEPPVAMPLEADDTGRAVATRNFLPGRYTVEPSRESGGRPVSVDLREGMGQVQLTLLLPGSGTILVQVRDEAGHALDGLDVGARSVSRTDGDEGMPVGTSAIPLGEGRYRVGPLVAGKYAVMAADRVNPAARIEGVSVAPGSTQDVRLTLVRSAKLQGRVVDERQEPQANVMVVARHAGADARDTPFVLASTPTAMTDADGAFVLDQLSPGTMYTLKAKQPFGSVGQLRDVAAGARVTLVLPSPATVSGTIVNADGQPARGVRVQGRHADTKTTRVGKTHDGQFEIRGLPPGRVQIVAVDDAGSVARSELALSAGQSLSGARLVLAPPTPHMQSLGSRALSNEPSPTRDPL